MVSPLSRVYITQDGGYKGIVVNIDKDIDSCLLDDLIQNIKVKLWQKKKISNYFGGKGLFFYLH